MQETKALGTGSDNFFGNGKGTGTERLRRRERIHKAAAESFRGRERGGGEEKLKGFGAADKAGQAGCASPTRNESTRSAWMKEYGIGGGDPAVAGKSEIEAAADAVATDGSNHGLGAGFQKVHQVLAGCRKMQGGLGLAKGDLGQGSADAEGHIGAGEDQAVDFRRQESGADGSG